MIKYVFIALISGFLLYFSYKYFKLKNDIKEVNYNIKNKIKYNGISCSNSNIDPDLLDLMRLYDNLIIKNNDISLKNEETEKNYRELMANISHDLRTPLTSVMGYISLVKEEKDIDKIHYYLNIAENKSLYLNNLIEKFYELSILSNGAKTVEKSYINIVSLLYNVGFEYYDIFKNRGESFEIISEFEKLDLLSSEKLLSSIFHNILDNMVKYSLGENKIEIINGESLILRFSNKIDVADGDYNFLFNRSEVLDKSRNVSTGLGLSIVDLSLKKLDYSGNIYIKNNIFYIDILIKK